MTREEATREAEARTINGEPSLALRLWDGSWEVQTFAAAVQP